MSNAVIILFLLALAFPAWYLISYFNAIENYRRTQDFVVELYIENPSLTSKQLSSENPASDVPRYFHTFEMMVSFCIALCLTYALLKFVEARAFLYWHSMEQDGEEQDNLGLLKEQLREKITNLRNRSELMIELLKKQQPSGGLELQPSVGLELQTRGSGCSLIQVSGCSLTQVSGSSSLELQRSGSSWTNCRSNVNAVSPTELLDRKKDVCSVSTRGRVSKVATATTSPSNTSIYISSSQLQIHAKMLNTEPINLDLVRASKLHARQPSVFLQVSDNFITGPRDRLMT